MQNYEIPAAEHAASGPYEVAWPFASGPDTNPDTRFSLAPTGGGFSVHIEAFLPVPLRAAAHPQKGRVFEDDCLEFFIRPQSSAESFFPAPFYYGWEIGANGALLDYRSGIGEEGRRIIGSGNGTAATDGSGAAPGVEPVHGILHEEILGTLISFDYDWKSKAVCSSHIEGSLWSVDIDIPWADFGLDAAPHDETWYFTVNRIDVSSPQAGGKMALACLHEGITEPRFHQPALFPALLIR